MDRSSILFCAGSLVASVALAWIFFPIAALDRATVDMAKTPQPAETMPMIEVGGGFGEVPAIELIIYYVDNPPAVSAAAAAPEIRFGGC
jgi:hypothetical protein